MEQQKKIFVTRKGPIYFSRNKIRYVLFAQIKSTVQNSDVSEDDLITMAHFWMEKIPIQPFEQNGVDIKIDLDVMPRTIYNFLIATGNYNHMKHY